LHVRQAQISIEEIGLKTEIQCTEALSQKRGLDRLSVGFCIVPFSASADDPTRVLSVKDER
jgi:hypothetical protein